MNGAHNYHKNIKMYVYGVPPSDLSGNVDKNIEACWHESPIQAHSENRSVFRTYVAENEIVCWCYLTPFMFIYVVLPIDMYIYIHTERVLPI